MKVKIVIKTMDKDGESHRSEVWSGEMDILDDDEYLVKMSIIAEGKPEPIVDIPFALGTGYYVWIPPENFTPGGGKNDTWNLT